MIPIQPTQTTTNTTHQNTTHQGDDPTTDNEVLFKFKTQDEAVKKCNEINDGE